MKNLLFILYGVFQCRIVLTTCPSTCTCSSDSVIHIEGSVTNCSGIDSNQLSYILANISSNVNTIYLDDIDIGHRQLVWPQFQQLNQLYIRRSGIEHVSQVLFGLQNATSSSFHFLDLSENHISTLDSTSFQFISSIETLDLQHNKIRQLKAGTFHGLPNLSYLYLSFNQIEVIDVNTFSVLSNLVMLELASNQLHWTKETIPVLNGLKSLIEIKLQNNSIMGLNDDIFLQTKNLKYLFLDDNALTSIPIRSCERLPRLTALYLTSNKISTVPEQLQRLKHLQYLYLTGNRITTVDGSSLNSLESLKHVWLNRNNLSEISQDLSTFFYRVKEINLLDNPWKCDCHLIWLVRWFKYSKNIHSPTCHENLANVSWLDIQLENLRCSVQKDCRPGERFCRKCPPFQYSIDGKTCRCMEGYEKLADSSQCSVCPTGSYSNGLTECRQCYNNSVSVSLGSTTCICRPGFHLKNSLCVECPVNQFKSKNGSYSCFSCPDYSTAPAGSVNSASCKCVNPDKSRSTYKTEYCLPPKIDSTALPISTFKQTPVINDDKHLHGPVVIGAASFFCTVILIMVVAFYVRRYGYHHRFNRRNIFKEIETEKITLSSTDWLDGFAIGRDGNYSARDIPIKKLKIGRALGKGAFGVVNEAYAYGGSSFDNKTFKVAVKRIKDTASGDEINSLKQELEQMKLIGSHANIISLYGFCKCRGQSMIIMELAELGDLLTYLKEKCSNSHNYVSVSADGNISEEETKQITEDGELMSFAWQVAKGMSHVESLKCIHRDLAARNVLLANGPVAKISDFGLSRDVYENGYYLKETKGRLPFKWLSPEALLWGQFSSKGDVWSYGMLLWEITTLGASPYPGIPAENMADLHRSGYRMPRPPNCPKDLYDIMRSCWNEDPRKRPTFLKLCELMESLLLGAVKLNYLEIRPNPIYNNEISDSDSYSDHILTTLSTQESQPCLQKFTEHHCDHSSGYMSSGLYS